MNVIKQVLEFIAKDNASKEMNAVTKASEGVGKSFNIMKNIVVAGAALIGGKAVIDAYSKQAGAMGALTRSANEAGVSVSGFIKESQRLQSTTLFGDEEIQKAQALGLQFDSLKGNLNELMPIVLDFSQATGRDLTSSMEYLAESFALPADGMNRLEEFGVILNEETKILTKSLQDQGRVAEGQAILMEELGKTYKGAATSARDTLGGGLKSLNNTLGDTGEIAGAVIDAFGKDFIESLIDVNTEFNNFATSTEGIKSIDKILTGLTGAFVGTKETLIEIGTYIYDNLIDPIKDMVAPLVGANDGLTVFGNTLDFVKKAMKILSDGIELFIINPFIMIVDIVTNVGKTIKAVFSGEMEDAIESGKKALDSYGDYIKKQEKTVQDLGRNVASVFTSSGDVITQNMKKAADSVEGDFQRSLSKIIGQANTTAGAIKGISKATKDMANLALLEGDVVASVFLQMSNLAEKSKNGIKVSFDEVKKVMSEVGDLVSAGNKLVSSGFSLAMDSLNNEIEALTTKSAEEIVILEERFTEEDKLRADEYAKKEEAILNEPISYRERNEKLAELEEEKLQNEKTILEKQEAEKKAVEDKNNAELYELQLKQAKAEKASAISNVWISAAVGILKGYEKGIIFGSINAATILALAGVQTGVIASQPPPPKPFKSGGVVSASVSGTTALIGEGGVDEMILPMPVFENMTSGGSGIYIENIYLTSNNLEELRADLLSIKEGDNARL